MYCIFYIDDVIVIGSSFEKCRDSLQLVMSTLQNCGSLINFKKSILTLSQIAPVLGFEINSKSESISLGEQKRGTLIKVFKHAVVSKSVKIRTFARSIGLCISILPCFPHGKMLYCHLENSKIKGLRKVGFKWNKSMTVSARDREILSWWLNTITANTPYTFRFPTISAWRETDSSLQGWRCSLTFLEQDISLHRSTGFHFGHSDSHHPINSKELLAIDYSLLTFK